MLAKVFFMLLFAATSSFAIAQTDRPVSAYLTTADRTVVLTRQGNAQQWQSDATLSPTVLRVDDSKPLQKVQGFGFALTGGSAQLLHRMSPEARRSLLQELFSRSGSGIGISTLRLTIGSSDLNDHVYTYDDMPRGVQDPELTHFSLKEDEADVIPVMQEILQIVPTLRIMASPWTAPSWMKTNGDSKGGSLQRRFYPAYAQYFVHYLKTMSAHGVPISAITIQNEPLNTENTPSMIMEAGEQTEFIRTALGPALRAARLNTEVLIWDHNCDHPEYPLAVLKDSQAAQYVSGTAFHLYEGSAAAMSQIHDAHPEKSIEFAEQMVIENRDRSIRPVAEPVENVVIAAMHNWSRTVLLWNLAADPQFGPHTTNGGCPFCQGAVTIRGDHVHRNIAYYAIAQISKFVPPGSVRVTSSDVHGLANVAFRTPAGQIVLLVTNNSMEARTFVISWNTRAVIETLPRGSVATFTW